MGGDVKFEGMWVLIEIPKALVVLPRQTFIEGLRRGKRWKRRAAMAAGHRGGLHKALEALRVAQVTYCQGLFRASAAGDGETCRAMSGLHEDARVVMERGTTALHRL